jgi:branched-chain amino acid transport system permease protein
VLAYIVSGLVLGSVYAIASTGIVVTYSATSVLNFAFGGIAYSAAVMYYTLHSTHGWPMILSAGVTIVIAGPAIGLLLWWVLFRHARQMSVVVKIVATVGVLVALPAATVLAFVPPAVYSAPGLANQPPHVYRLGAVTLDANELVVLVGAALVALLMSFLLRGTGFGLAMRAVVDRPTVAEAHGTRTAPVEAVAWMIGCFLAAFAGVLLAPIVGLGSANFSGLVITSLAAAVVGRLRSVPVAFGVAIAMGVVQSVLVDVAPTGGLLATAVQPAIPLIVLILFLLVGPTIEQRSTTQVIVSGDRPAPKSKRTIPVRVTRLVVVVAVAIVVPLLLTPYWMAAVAAGLAMGIVFLSFVVLGSGGITSLGQAAYAGFGGFFTAFLISSHGFPDLVAVVIGGLVAAVIGTLVALVTTRLGVLSLAIMTVAIAGFFDQFVVNLTWLVPGAGGSIYARPSLPGLSFASDRAFAYLMMVIFVIGAFVVTRVLRGPTGLALRAVRSDEVLSKAIGLSPRMVRLLVFASSSFIAGVGGALLGMYQLHLGPGDVATLVGFVWLAVIVTIGWRHPAQALVAGLVFYLMPAVFTRWLPGSWSQVPTILFGLGAVALAQAPDGVISMYGGYINNARARFAKAPAETIDGQRSPAEAQ